MYDLATCFSKANHEGPGDHVDTTSAAESKEETSVDKTELPARLDYARH